MIIGLEPLKLSGTALEKRQKKEIDRLRAENAKQVEEWKDETNYYQAEARKLRARQDEVALAWTKLTDSQEKEIDQLRAALEVARVHAD